MDKIYYKCDMNFWDSIYQADGYQKIRINRLNA
jgi:hypothetical protein